MSLIDSLILVTHCGPKPPQSSIVWTPDETNFCAIAIAKCLSLISKPIAWNWQELNLVLKLLFFSVNPGLN